MKKKEKINLKIILALTVILVICVSVLIWAIVSDADSDMSLTINGTIINVEHIGKSEVYRYGEVFELTFDTGDIINVESASYDNDLLDLSTGRHIIMRLWKDEPSYNWDIKQVVVIENNVEEG